MNLSLPRLDSRQVTLLLRDMAPARSGENGQKEEEEEKATEEGQ